MRIQVKRFSHPERATVGHVYVDGQDTGYFSLEDETREIAGYPVPFWKVDGETAIPCGTYKVVVDFSPHFNRDLPHVLDVPGFDGVRIHPGNTDADTEGCVLIGHEWNGGDYIGHSREAFEDLFEQIKLAMSRGEAVILEVA